MAPRRIRHFTHALLRACFLANSVTERKQGVLFPPFLGMRLQNIFHGRRRPEPHRDDPLPVHSKTLAGVENAQPRKTDSLAIGQHFSAYP
jgi:hypothetical protein